VFVLTPLTSIGEDESVSTRNYNVKFSYNTITKAQCFSMLGFIIIEDESENTMLNFPIVYTLKSLLFFHVKLLKTNLCIITMLNSSIVYESSKCFSL
jgi:hypothetical protein